MKIVDWVGIGKAKFYGWQRRYGKVNEHNAQIPRDHWLVDWEKQAILDYHEQHPLSGYRRLTYEMLDADIVAASASSVYRVLKGAGVLDRWSGKGNKKGTGFHQPERPHDHWHIDISYINVEGTFYYLCSVLDGCSRYIVHWELRESMKEPEVDLVIQRARERYPEATPRIISDNGPQFIARDFKTFIRLCGMTHVRTSPYYPQSNGKIERWHKSLKSECIRRQSLQGKAEAEQHIKAYVNHYNTERLHSAIGYVTPQDKLDGKEKEIFKARDKKLAAARELRKNKRLKVETSESPKKKVA